MPAIAAVVWKMTGNRWRGVVRSDMRDRRAARFAVVVRMARLPRAFFEDGTPYHDTAPLLPEYQYAPEEPWLDLGGEG